MNEKNQQTEPNILKRLALLLGTEVKNGRLNIPDKYGNGYCSGFVFNEHIRMLILNYELKEDIVIENPEINIPGKMLLFKFQNIVKHKEVYASTAKPLNAVPSVLITTSTVRLTPTKLFPFNPVPQPLILK
jgi:O-glycosyl hydrolase